MTARTLVCIMNIEEAQRLGMKIIGMAKAHGYEGKCLVQMAAFLK